MAEVSYPIFFEEALMKFLNQTTQFCCQFIHANNAIEGLFLSEKLRYLWIILTQKLINKRLNNWCFATVTQNKKDKCLIK